MFGKGKIIKYILFFLVCIFGILIFLWFGFDVKPIALGKYFLTQLSSTIGVSVSIAPNPFNTAAEQLQEKERALSVKENDLKQKEEQTVKEKSGLERFNIYLLAGGGFLLGLILFNFYLDFRRKKLQLSQEHKLEEKK